MPVTKRFLGAAFVVAVSLGLQPVPAAAKWRVVGPGIAVGNAQQGPGSLAVECGTGGLALAAFGYDRRFDAGAGVTLTIDGTPFGLIASGGATRIALAEPGREGEGLSAELRSRLEGGRNARLSGDLFDRLPEERLSFSLLGSRDAMADVERTCD